MKRSREFEKNACIIVGILAISIMGAPGCQRNNSNRTGPLSNGTVGFVIQPGDDGKTIVGNFLKVLSGGDEPLIWNRGFVKYKAKIGIWPIEDGESVVEDTFDLPRHWKRFVRAKTPSQEFQMLFVINDGKGWKKIGDGETQPAEMKYEMEQHDFAMFWNFAPSLEEKREFKRLGEEEIENHAAIVVQVKPDEQTNTELYFDKHNGLLIKSKKSIPGKTPQTRMIMESFLEDYRNIQGRMIPMHIRSFQDGQPILDITMIEVKFLEKVASSEFEEPVSGSRGDNPKKVEPQTILIYEIDPDRSPNVSSPQELARAVQRRVDPSDSAGIKVRPLGDTRIEISIPRSTSDPSPRVQRVKELLSQAGKLEFRILANAHDDQLGIEASRKYFKSKHNSPQIKAELESRARKGQPPPAPDGKFVVHLHDYHGKYSYKWVEAGRQYRDFLKLNDPAGAEEPSFSWQQASEARAKDEPFLLIDALLYSRKVITPSGTNRNKKYEYFLLTRDPEDKSKEVTGEFLTRAHELAYPSNRYAVGFHFNKKGSDRFRHLTSINVPEGKGEDALEFKRQLAIILDEQIVSAPSLNDVISDGAVIDGNFTKQEVERLADILRSGALPATLKPQPVSEISLEPQK
jgi:hypothetical protein